MAEPDTRLVLIRHGESDAQVNGYLSGHDACQGLSDLGRTQVAALRDRLASTGELADVDRVYTSLIDSTSVNDQITDAVTAVNPDHELRLLLTPLTAGSAEPGPQVADNSGSLWTAFRGTRRGATRCGVGRDPDDGPDTLRIGPVHDIPIIDADDPRFSAERQAWSRARAIAQAKHSPDDPRTLPALLDLACSDPVDEVRATIVLRLLEFDAPATVEVLRVAQATRARRCAGRRRSRSRSWDTNRRPTRGSRPDGSAEPCPQVADNSGSLWTAFRGTP